MKYFLMFCAVLLAVQLTSARLISLAEIIRGYDAGQDIGGTRVEVATEHLFIPTSLKACTDAACQNICRMLGFDHGTCVSASTCHCYN